MARRSTINATGKRIVAVAILVGLYLAGVYLLQRRVLFPAPRLTSPVGSHAATVISLAQPAGATEALFLQPAVAPGTRVPLIIFTHGNGETADDWVDEFAEPLKWGWAALLVEYPGYGRSPGAPSERSIHATMLAAYDWARHDARIDTTRIVAYGRSVGGGPAARLAADHSLPALILESAFTSVRPLAARMLVPGFLVRDPFDNVAALRRYRGAVLVIHGSDDEVIPVSHGRALSRVTPEIEYHELRCGHNDCPRPWALIWRFLTHLTPSP